MNYKGMREDILELFADAHGKRLSGMTPRLGGYEGRKKARNLWRPRAYRTHQTEEARRRLRRVLRVLKAAQRKAQRARAQRVNYLIVPVASVSYRCTHCGGRLELREGTTQIFHIGRCQKPRPQALPEASS